MTRFDGAAQSVDCANTELTLVSAWLRQRDEQQRPLAARIPLGLLYLLAATRAAGFSSQVCDVQLFDKGDSSADTPLLIREAIEGSGMLVGISCMSDLLPAVIVATKHYKLYHPSTKIILGGPGPSIIGMELLHTFPWLDVVVKGEGEQTLVELLNTYKNRQPLQRVAGICARTNQGVINTSEQPRLVQLDQLLPLPYTDLPLDRYQTNIPFITSRGCPYPCKFCAVANLWGHRTTWHSVPAVIHQLQELGVIGCHRVAFVDDTFVLNRGRVLELCHKLESLVPTLEWHCNGRINLMDEELLTAMRSAGCRSIFFGLESGSNTLLQEMHKGFNVEEAVRVITLSASYMHVAVSFIWGFPNETWDDFCRTYAICEQLLELSNVSLQIHLLTPYPGTPVYEQYAEHLVFDPGIHSHIRSSKHLSTEEESLIRCYRSLFPSFYHFPTPQLHEKLAYVERLQKRIG